MSKFNCVVQFEAEDPTEMVGTITALPGVNRVYGVEEDEDLPEDDDDDDDLD